MIAWAVITASGKYADWGVLFTILTTLSLGLWALMRSDWRHVESRLIVTALFICAFADYVLGTGTFMAGMVSFLVVQVLFCIIFCGRFSHDGQVHCHLWRGLFFQPLCSGDYFARNSRRHYACGGAIIFGVFNLHGFAWRRCMAECSQKEQNTRPFCGNWRRAIFAERYANRHDTIWRHTTNTAVELCDDGILLGRVSVYYVVGSGAAYSLKVKVECAPHHAGVTAVNKRIVPTPIGIEHFGPCTMAFNHTTKACMLLGVAFVAIMF